MKQSHKTNSQPSNSNDLSSAANMPNATSPDDRKLMGVKTAARWSGVSVLAAFVTLGLGITMTSLIAAEFQAQDKLEAANYNINPVPDDIVVIPNRREIDPYKEVETPPAPPKISDAKMERVEVLPLILDGSSDVFNPTEIKFASLEPIAIDQDYQPTVRIEPRMPSRAMRSGHCQMVFDVSASGQTYNVQATSCSQSLFESASRKAVAQWRYNPKMRDGQAMSTSGVKTRISFKLKDENGRLIPE